MYLYRSPNSTCANNEQLHMMQKANDGRYSHVVVMGDVSCQAIDWSQECSNAGTNHQATKFLKGMRDAYMYKHVKQPTHQISYQQHNIFDIVQSNEADMVEEISYRPPIGKSHHALLQGE